MKKNLIIFGLLLCTSGFAFADETVISQANENPITQTEVQSQIDKNTFNNIERNQKFNRSLNDKTPKEKIKYDKSIKDNKYKNFDKRSKYDNDFYNKKSDYKGVRPELQKGYKPDIRGHRPAPDRFSEHRPPKHHQIKREHRPPMNMKKAHRPQINNQKRQSHNIKRNIGRV